MRKILSLIALVFALAGASQAAEWTGHLMDSMCAPTMRDKAASHTAECMKGCRDSGYGLVTQDGKYIKFNEAGNTKAVAELERSGKQENLLVKVAGELKGGVIQVESITMQ
jgi:hypothetical protein